MAKPNSSKRGAPSTQQQRDLAQHRALRTPRDLRLESSTPGPVVVSFPISDVDWRELLTPAEIAVAEDALAGLDNARIASRRGAAVRTIANQLSAIYRKLNVRSRLELSLYALAGRRTFDRKS